MASTVSGYEGGDVAIGCAVAIENFCEGTLRSTPTTWPPGFWSLPQLDGAAPCACNGFRPTVAQSSIMDTREDEKVDFDSREPALQRAFASSHAEPNATIATEVKAPHWTAYVAVMRILCQWRDTYISAKADYVYRLI